MSASPFVPRQDFAPRLEARLRRRLARLRDRAGQGLAERGVPARWLGQAWRPHVPAAGAAQAFEVHGPRHVAAPMPWNFSDPRALSDLRGWWGFSMRDVPNRLAGPSRLLTIDEARVLTAEAPGPARDFAPAILDRRGRSLDLREIRFRAFHAAPARREARGADLEMGHAVWVAERVFDNYAHWFTAHLPKLLLLREEGMLGGLVLPTPRPAWLDASLRLVGIDPDAAAQLPRGGTLRAASLTVVESDRFRPELLRAAHAALARMPERTPTARVFVSRRSARGRRLVDEAGLMPLLARHGFEAVEMERLGLDEQIALMGRTAVLLAPHGAGLTNMLFCPPGAKIIEIGDPDYPNPNFYAMAAALGHPYAWVAARGVGAGHPLDRDLAVEPEALERLLEALP